MRICGINALAVIAAAAASMAVGAIWYAPALFGDQWMAISGVSMAEMEEGMARKYGLASLVSLVIAAALAVFIRWTGRESLRGGLEVAALAWLGFNLPFLAGGVIWAEMPAALLPIEGGAMLASLLAMGAILGGWGAPSPEGP